MENNINILKLLCKKIQVRGNYLSIKKRMFELLYANNIINFEKILLNNLLNILCKLIYIINQDESKYKLNVINLHNFINFTSIVFKFVCDDLKAGKNKFCLVTYIYSLYSNLYNIINNKLDIDSNLYKFFYKNYLNYLLKLAKSGIYNTYAVERESTNIYFYKYINVSKISSKVNIVNKYFKSRYYNLFTVKYIHNLKKIKKFRINYLK